RELEAMIRELARGCLERAAPRGGCDAMADFASQISVKVACIVTGVPIEDGDLMNSLVWRFFGREPGHTGMTPGGLAAMRQLVAYFTDLSRARRRSGSRADDIVNLLNEIEIDGARLDEASIASHLAMFIIGGSETVPKVFANDVLLLAQHPEQRAECVRDPSLVPNAFLQGLRFLRPPRSLASSGCPSGFRRSPFAASGRGTSSCRARRCAPASRCSSSTPRRTATSASSATPTSSTSTAASRACSPSGTAPTPASG